MALSTLRPLASTAVGHIALQQARSSGALPWSCQACTGPPIASTCPVLPNVHHWPSNLVDSLHTQLMPSPAATQIPDRVCAGCPTLQLLLAFTAVAGADRCAVRNQRSNTPQRVRSHAANVPGIQPTYCPSFGEERMLYIAV